MPLRSPGAARLRFLAGLALLALAVPAARAQTVDSTLWVTDGPVNAIVRDGNTLYLGGSFTRVGEVTGGGIPLGSADGLPRRPFPRVLGSVMTVVPDGSGGWFIGGSFSSVGGRERLNLAHVLADGSVADWAPNPNGQVQALALDGGRLYAGGYFTWIGQRWRDYIAAVDVSSGIAYSWNPGANLPVRALAVGGGVVYAGGDFITLGGQARRNIGAIDAVTGAVTAWNPDADEGVHALALRGGRLYAGGEFSRIGGQYRGRLAALDLIGGTSTPWNPVVNGTVLAIAVGDSSIYFGGEFTLVGNNSRRYLAAVDTVAGVATPWDPGASWWVSAMAMAGAHVYVGGDFMSVGGELRAKIAALDAVTGRATAWNPDPNGQVIALAVSGDVVYAGGGFVMVGGVPRNNLAALDLGTGGPTPWNPNPNSSVSSIAVSGDLVYVGGAFTTIAGQNRGRLAALQAGTGAATPWNPNANDLVKTLVVRGNTVYVGGHFWLIRGQQRFYLAAVDATTGDPLSWAPNPNNAIHTLAVRDTTVYAGGQFTSIGGQPRSRIAAVGTLSGRATPWDANAGGIVDALAVGDSLVYAGGEFSTMGGQPRGRIAALDATTGAVRDWNPGAIGPVRALAIDGNTVFAGGSFQTIGGVARSHIAALDATTGTPSLWNPGADAYVSALAVGDATLYAGGGFTVIGGQVQPFMAAIRTEVSTPASVPTFVSGVTVSTGSVAVGEAVTITAIVRNDGAPSDDGRIVFSFKDLTDPADGQRVTSPSGGDQPGFRLVPRGSTLLDRDCGPMTASYLVAEYADSAWAGLGAETDTLRVTVRPRAPGVFSIDVRSTMRAAGSGPCAYTSAIPDGGNTTITDQQGWMVRRFVVYVNASPAQPQPVFGNVGLSSAAITLGQSVTLSTQVWNSGGFSDDGRIVVSFPELTDPLDAPRVTCSTSGDTPGFRTFAAGSTLADSACRPIVAPYLVAEYADGQWDPIGHEINPFVITIVPREPGTLTIDVRSTMHTGFGPPCEYVNGLPSTGVAGFRDAQGWPVRRFSLIVLAPPTVVVPAFYQPVSVSADSIVLGQEVAITAHVWNLGVASDDGRIVMSFPALTDTADGTRVRSGSGGDSPGFRRFPAGAPLLGSACQPVTASYLVAEYVDDNWAWVGTEVNAFTAWVTPRAVGEFVFYARATMRTVGGDPCAYRSAVPPNGEDGFVDQQGWPVRRFVVHVKPPPVAPVPVFISPVTLSSNVIQLGQEFTIRANVGNLGAASDDGRIVFSFPALTDTADDQRVVPWSGDYLTYRETRAGSPLLDTACQPRAAAYLVAELVDDNWTWLGTENHMVTLGIRPRVAGAFAIDVRTTMHTAGGGPCEDVNALPPNGSGGYVEQQGWTVKRFYVSVSPAPPNPVFLSPVGISAGIIDLGQSLTLTTTVGNNGATSDDGRVVFSFPTLTDPADAQTVGWGTADDRPGYRVFPAGSALLTADCQQVTATCLTAEFADSSWVGPGTESNTVALTVRPRRTGTFVIEVRASMHAVGGGPCGYVNQVPSNGHSGFLDQQGYAVNRFNVTVLSTPARSIPTFIGDLLISTDAIGVGGALTITAAARNNGAWSDDGRIVIAFPSLDQAGDGQWVTTSSSGDTPGFRKYAVGASIRNRACENIASRHLVAEYADARWDSIGDETNIFTVTVRPPREGLLTIEVRATMRTAGVGPCAYENALPANGEGGFTDQQGWEVRRFEVYVGSTPSMTWGITGPSGGTPAARALQAAVYDATRDELVLYGGTAQTYTGDSWALPLPGQQSWSQLQPGGPVPLRRIMHSMIHDSVNGNLVIFGGIYDDVLDDLWVLARAPLSWWFPISPAGARPGARMAHSAVYDPVRQRMLVIGGFGRSLYNDVWEYSPMVNGTWKQLAPAGPPLPARATFSAIYDPVRDRVLVFGGDGGTFLNDVWALDLGGSLAWQPITPAGAPPGPRREHTAVYDPQWDEMIVFGGFNGTKRLNDVWTLSLSGVPRWERRFTESGSPLARSGHSAVYDPVRQRMLVFGGQLSVNTYTNEVWELKIDRATPVAISLAETEVAPDHVRLSWFGEGITSLAASVERSTDESEWVDLGAPSPQGPDHLEMIDRDVIEGGRYAYRLRVWQEGTEEVLGPVWVTVPVRAVLSLAGALPNPVTDAFTVAFSLPEEGRGALEVFDLRGRRVVQRDLTGMPAGPHRLAMAEGRRLPAGIYWVRLTHRDRHLIAKACVVR